MAPGRGELVRAVARRQRQAEAVRLLNQAECVCRRALPALPGSVGTPAELDPDLLPAVRLFHEATLAVQHPVDLTECRADAGSDACP
jgi:hypothetical protein